MWVIIAGGSRENPEHGRIIGLQVHALDSLQTTARMLARRYGANVWAIPIGSIDSVGEDWATPVLAVPPPVLMRPFA